MAPSLSSTRRSSTLQKTEVSINVYDLLPASKLSSFLWTIGTSLLHSGVVINGKEYAYGGHNRPGLTGVYWTRARFEPPGGTWKCEILHGFTFRTEKEIEAMIKEVSDDFLGPSYNLLENNCNHFTSALCEKLTGKSAPSWINRAASIGLALPCVVPREWVNPPDHDTADGELLDAEDEDEDEGASMLESDRRRRQKEETIQARLREREAAGEGGSLAGGRRLSSQQGDPPPRVVSLKDSTGRPIPAAERAPVPKRP